MPAYRKNCFLFISLMIVAGCRTPLHSAFPSKGDRHCFDKFVPAFGTQWYKAGVDVVGNHLSGLLLFKSFPADSTTRVVFTSEAGATFFDFEFRRDQTKVNFVLPQLDKGPVIRTLQHDLDLTLMRFESDKQAELLQDDKATYLRIPRGRKTIWLISEDGCKTLKNLEEEWGGKKKVEVLFYSQGVVPDSMSIRHFNFNMQINLRKLQR